MAETDRDFAFVDGGRTFDCRVETAHRAPAEAWWWFHVSTERYQRYAPFRAETADTRVDVQARVLAYYDHLLARRAEPPQRRWGRPRPPTAAPGPTP